MIAALLGAGAMAAMPACSRDTWTPHGQDPVVLAEKAPPPISGGTLLVTDDGIAVAADSDRDVVWLVDLNGKRKLQSVSLKENDEPGRVVLDGAGHAHVLLRRGGAVATIDVNAGKLLDRTPVCPAPRGVAYDAAIDALHVACAGGELVTLPAAGGAALRTLRLERDLRDVMISGDKLVVSRFRAAELIVLDADGKVAQRRTPATFTSNFQDQNGATPFFTPAVAWRTVAVPGMGFAMAHQRALSTTVVIQPGGYEQGGGCDGSIVQSTVTLFGEDGTTSDTPNVSFAGAALPVDVAVDAESGKIAVVAAGSGRVLTFTKAELEQNPNDNPCGSTADDVTLPEEPIAVAFFKGEVVVQTRKPAIVRFSDLDSPITLPGVEKIDSGHKLFHHAAAQGGSLACASCHPEGGDDAHTWEFAPIGPRRTQTLSGDVLATAPLHWDGDMHDLDAIMDEVFVNRMGGQHQGPRHLRAFRQWISTVPSLPQSAPAADADTIARGKALFNDATVGCASCHAGGRMTNNQNADVGTGKAFQVPSLVGIAARAPFMHNGCAPTLKDRFASPNCGGGDKHGKTSHLSDAQVDDLIAYLETL